MKRIAFVSPVPSAPTGVADYAAEVLDLLAETYAIDVFHGPEPPDPERLPQACRLFPASSLPERHRAAPYHAAVHQMGNATAHAFVYEALARVPGLLVLHDLVLHHARAREFLDGPEVRAYSADPGDPGRAAAVRAALDRYQAEVEYAYPGKGRRVARAQLDTVGDLLPYAYPLFRLPVEASRVVAVHNGAMAAAVREEAPEVDVVMIPMPVTAMRVEREAARALRARYGIGQAAFVVGTFGLITREKRVETVARAVARAAATNPEVRLLVVGPVADAPALRAELAAAGVADRAILTGRVPFDELGAHMEISDAVVHLRHPTARETSAALLRVLAQGRPTIMADLDNTAEVPPDAVLRVDLSDEEGEVTRALLRLMARPALRIRLGERARAFVAHAHAPARCRAAYVAAIELTAARPDPPARDWPAHWAALRRP